MTPDLEIVALRVLGDDEISAYDFTKRAPLELPRGRVYKVLGELERKGLILGRVAPVRHCPDRRVYRRAS